MYRILVFAAFFLSCLFVLGKGAFAAQSPGALRLAYPNFPPFHWQDEKGRMRGMFVEILNGALVQRMQQPVRWTAYPWARCQEQLKAGQQDAIITVPTVERSAYTRTHQHPFFCKPLHLFTSVDHPRFAEISRIRALSDIRDLGLSVITYSTNGWHRDHVAALGIKSHESAYLENVWVMLAERRGDLVIEWPRGARPDLHRLGLERRVVDTGIEIAHMPFHLLIRSGSPHVHLLDRFDHTIGAMKADGSLDVILRRYDEQ